MSFRDKQVAAEETPAIVEAKPMALPSKPVFADGLCNVCNQALFDHPEEKGVKYDCNGWPLDFIDEPQAVVKARADAALKAQEDARLHD